MMPRIEAGEALAAVGRAALTNNIGYADQLDRERAMDALRYRASGEAPPAPAKADPADLAAMGIGMKAADGEQLPTIDNLEGWLGATSHDAVTGEQGHG